jgi:hypothetical protein
MDNLNKLRLLAGVPVKYTPSAPKPLAEARSVPQRKTELAEKNEENMRARVNYMNAAAQAVAKAIHFLDQIPSTDFMGDVPHFVAELESLLNGDDGEGGMADLAAKYQTEFRSWKRKFNAMKRANEAAPVAEAFEDDDFDDDREFADKSADLDAQAFGASKGKGKTSDRVAAKIDAYAKSAVDDEAEVDDEESGWDIPDEEFDDDELAMGDVEDGDLDASIHDEFGDDEFGDEEVEFDDEGMHDDGDLDRPLPGEHDGPDEDEMRDFEDDEIEDDEFEFDVDGEAPEAEIGDEEFDDGVAGRRWPSDKKRPHGTMESTNFYYDKDHPRPETDKAMKFGDDKNESPNQLEKLKPSPSDHETKIKVPNSVKQALRDEAKQAREDSKRLGVTDKDALWFYENLAKAFEELLGHLEAGTLYDIKKAQIFMTSLMGPMLHKIPAEVVNFVAKGGENRSLKDFMKPVDNKYPVTGKMYQGD